MILFGANVRSPAQARALGSTLRRAAASGGDTHLLVLVDQEGGDVRRLSWAPPAASAATMGSWDAARVRLEGERTGRALRSLGIDVDLAPVADAATPGASFLGDRSFDRDPDAVAVGAAAFASGLRAAGVEATAKHFPGLGAALRSTDAGRVTVTASRAELLHGLLPFRRAIAAGARLVMVSSAVYPALDGSRRPALFSRAIVTGLLRRQLGFRGVVITDSMDAPGARAADAPRRALLAGDDLLLYTSARSSEGAFRTLVAQARTDAALRARLREAYRSTGSLR